MRLGKRLEICPKAKNQMVWNRRRLMYSMERWVKIIEMQD